MNMNLFETIRNYTPSNAQEAQDQAQMLQFMTQYDNYLLRENQIAHFTASVWVVNRDRTKTLMAYHNLYRSWSWLGGHADGCADLAAVAMKELEEEAGIKHGRLLSNEPISLETLTVGGHIKKGKHVSGHLHFNLTYLVEADENEALSVNEAENQAVKWWPLEEALAASAEPWMVENIYKKLIKKCGGPA